MATQTNNAEGQADGTVLVSGNSGGASGNSFVLVTTTGSSVITFSSDQAAHGSQSYKLSHASAQQAYPSFQLATASSGGAMRFYLYLPTTLTATDFLGGLRTTSGYLATMYMTTAGKIVVQDGGGGSPIQTANGAVTTGTWYRIELAANKGTGTTDGQIRFALYALDSTTAIYTNSVSNANTGTADLTLGRFGRTTGAGNAQVMYYDDLALSDQLTGFIGPYSTANTAPSANAGTDQTNLEPWSTVTLTGTDSDGDGTVVTRAWRQVSGSPTVTLSGSGATRTYTAPPTIAGTTLQFGYKVTDNDGADSAENTVNHTILYVNERAVLGGVEVPMRIDEVT